MEREREEETKRPIPKFRELQFDDPRVVPVWATRADPQAAAATTPVTLPCASPPPGPAAGSPRGLRGRRRRGSIFPFPSFLRARPLQRAEGAAGEDGCDAGDRIRPLCSDFGWPRRRIYRLLDPWRLELGRPTPMAARRRGRRPAAVAPEGPRIWRGADRIR